MATKKRAPKPAPETDPISPELLRRTGVEVNQALVRTVARAAPSARLSAAWDFVRTSSAIPDRVIAESVRLAPPAGWELGEPAKLAGELDDRAQRLLLAWAVAFYVQGQVDAARKNPQD